MTSKTFKSALSTDKELRITGGPERVCFAQRAHNGMESLVFIDNTEAPAVALAILEAAGFEDSSTGGHITGARIAVGDLKRHVKMQERATAEAEAQAKLEAEALELHQLFESLQSDDETVWLAVARRARELNKEGK